MALNGLACVVTFGELLDKFGLGALRAKMDLHGCSRDSAGIGTSGVKQPLSPNCCIYEGGVYSSRPYEPEGIQNHTIL
jgi:hypothetical protein